MLKAEIIKGSAVLASLTDEQVTAIEELSKNDETAVMAKAVGDLHGQYDRDIEEATGLKKPDGMKTYEWMKKDVLPKVTKATKLQSKLDKAIEDKTALETQLKDGKIDEATKQKLSDNENLITDLRGQLSTQKTESEKALTEAQNKNATILINNEFDRALVGKKFKDENIISKAVRESFISNAKQAILAEYKPDWIDDGKGGQKLVFRNEAGEIARNEKNGLNPFTAEELFTNKIGDVLEVGKQQQGGGTKPPTGGGANPTELNLSGAKSQVEADDIATNFLMDKGLVRGTNEFSTEFDKIRDENKVADLPIR